MSVLAKPIPIRRHVERVMGTVVSFDVRTPLRDAVIQEACLWLHTVDAIFSTYRPHSQISRLGRGELRVGQCDRMVLEVLELCSAYQQLSDGYFTATPHGTLDPSAVVKGWAVEAASAILTRAGSLRHAVCGGGDIQLVGDADRGEPWQVGIEDPFRPARVAAVAQISRGAIATSGTAQRAQHIVNPRTGRPACGLASVTVVAESLTHADALATAAFAMGEQAQSWLSALPDVEAYLIAGDGRQWATTGFPFSPAVPARQNMSSRDTRSPGAPRIKANDLEDLALRRSPIRSSDRCECEGHDGV